MVRIGGGWDTLQNYLNRHDPCRCDSTGKKGTQFNKLLHFYNLQGHACKMTWQLAGLVHCYKLSYVEVNDESTKLKVSHITTNSLSKKIVK